MWKCDWCQVTLNLINAPNIFCFKTCKIYLCGTKKDLVDADKRLRQVDYHTTTDYADGLYYWIVKFFNHYFYSIVFETFHEWSLFGKLFSEIHAQVFETSSKTGENISKFWGNFVAIYIFSCNLSFSKCIEYICWGPYIIEWFLQLELSFFCHGYKVLEIQVIRSCTFSDTIQYR